MRLIDYANGARDERERNHRSPALYRRTVSAKTFLGAALCQEAAATVASDDAASAAGARAMLTADAKQRKGIQKKKAESRRMAAV